MKKIAYSFICLCLGFSTLQAQTYCIGYNVVSRTATDLVMQLKIQGSSSFTLATSNLNYHFNGNAMSAPVMLTPRPTQGNSVLVYPSPYVDVKIVPYPTQVNFVIELGGGQTGITVAAAPAWTILGRISFTITDASQTTGFYFSPPGSVVYSDDIVPTTVPQGSGCPVLDAPLPIEILSLTAKKLSRATLLQWTSVNAMQMSHFEVERSADGNHFDALGQVKAVNMTDAKDYQFTDVQPIEGLNYYRLKMVEINGKTAFSKTISILFGNDFIVKASPNPFHDLVSVEVTSGKTVGDMSFELLDITGKTVVSQQHNYTNGKLNISLPTENLTAGSYILRIKDAAKVWQEKFIKQ